MRSSIATRSNGSPRPAVAIAPGTPLEAGRKPTCHSVSGLHFCGHRTPSRKQLRALVTEATAILDARRAKKGAPQQTYNFSVPANKQGRVLWRLTRLTAINSVAVEIPLVLRQMGKRYWGDVYELCNGDVVIQQRLNEDGTDCENYSTVGSGTGRWYVVFNGRRLHEWSTRDRGPFSEATNWEQTMVLLVAGEKELLRPTALDAIAFWQKAIEEKKRELAVAGTNERVRQAIHKSLDFYETELGEGRDLMHWIEERESGTTDDQAGGRKARPEKGHTTRLALSKERPVHH
jgi:hypothetical protein